MIRLSIPDLEMLMQAMEAVAWGASLDGKPTELGRRADKLKARLRDEHRRLDRLATGAAMREVLDGASD